MTRTFSSVLFAHYPYLKRHLEHLQYPFCLKLKIKESMEAVLDLRHHQRWSGGNAAVNAITELETHRNGVVHAQKIPKAPVVA